MERKIKLFNPWWEENRIPPELYSEFSFSNYDTLEGLLQEKRVLAILGARQVGKTYVLYYLIDNLFKRGVSPQNILFLSMDDRIVDIETALSFYEKIILKKSLFHSEETHYIFLDEIQLFRDWQNVIKSYIEEKYPLKFILASSSQNYFKKNDLLLGDDEYSEVHLLPLCFSEYLKYRKILPRFDSISLSQIEDNSIFNYKVQYVDYFNEFDNILKDFVFQGGYHRYYRETHPLIRTQKITSQIVDMSIFKDISTIYENVNPKKVEDLLLLIARQTASIFDCEYLMNLLGLSRQVIDNYTNYLESSFLIHSTYNYNTDLVKQNFSPKKIYLSDLGIRNSIVGERNLNYKDVNRLIDNMIFLHLNRLKNKYRFDLAFWKKGSLEIDIVMLFNDKAIPIIINYRSKDLKNHEKSLSRFFDSMNCDQGIIISKDIMEIQNIVDKKILVIPAWLFLLIN